MIIKTRDELIMWLIISFDQNQKFEYYKSLQGKTGFTDNE